MSMGIPGPEPEEPTSFRSKGPLRALAGSLVPGSIASVGYLESKGIPVTPDDPMDVAFGAGFLAAGYVVARFYPGMLAVPDVAIIAAGVVTSNVLQTIRRVHAEESGVRGSGLPGVPPSFHLEGGKPWWN